MTDTTLWNLTPRPDGTVWLAIPRGGTLTLDPADARHLADRLLATTNQAEAIRDQRTPCCPSCGVGMRRPHSWGCTVARCTSTGVRVIDCPISHAHDEDPDIWTGTVQAPTPHPGVDL